MRITLLIVFSLGYLYSWGQDDIQYQNKVLERILKENDVQGFAFLSEIEIPDSLIPEYRLHGKFFEIDNEISQYKYVYTGRVNSCRSGGCSISVEPVENGETEYFDYFILFDRTKTVGMVKVFNYQATHGQEVTSRGWLKQFIGYSGSESLIVDKNIDAISGATISVYAITMDVSMKTELLNQISD